MERTKCHHTKFLSIPSEAKLRNPVLLNNFEDEMLRCTACDKNSQQVWICLEENCMFMGCDQEERFHINNHLQDMKKLNNMAHTIFLHPQTLQIHCFECKTEIYDSELAGSTDGHLDPARIRDYFGYIFGYSKNDGLKYVQSLRNAKNYVDVNKGLTGLINLGNTSHFNAMVQLLAHIPSIKSFYKALNKSMSNDNYLPPGSAKRFSYLLADLVSNIWTGEWRVFKPNAAANALFDLYPTLKGYGEKDIHETFRHFINVLHEEHRILIPKAFELGLKPTINTAKKPDEWEIIRNLSDYLENSIITDTFQGKMHSNFKCEQCREELHLEDYFTYLELKIPKNKDFQRLKKWNINLESSRKDSYSREDTFHIYESVAEFFETKFIRPFGNLYCEKCYEKTPYQKSYRFLNMPNMLCLHIKRKGIMPELNMKVSLSLDNFDLGPFMKQDSSHTQDETKYELVGYIENYGTDERPKYVTTAKNPKTEQWYTFKDHEIIKRDPKSVSENYALMILYKKKLSVSRAKEVNNLKSQKKLMNNKDIKLPESKLALIPNHWVEKAISLSQPGMMHTWHLLCKHNKIKPSYSDCFSQQSRILNTSMTNSSMLDSSYIDRSYIVSPDDVEDSKSDRTTAIIENQSVKLPIEIAEYFLEKYGGGPLIRAIDVCADCQEEAIWAKSRKRRERKLVSLYDSKKTPVYYAVSQEWIEDWKNFLYVNNRFMRRNFLKGHAPPGPVDNNKLFDKPDQLKLLLERNVNYRVVNAYIWKMFMEIYGGGPEIKLNGKDIYYNQAKDEKFEVNFPSHDLEVIKELRDFAEEHLEDPKKPVIAKDEPKEYNRSSDLNKSLIGGNP